MPTEINKPKVIHELYAIKFHLGDFKKGFERKRLSPATKQVLEMLVSAVDACADAVREGHPLMFEINIWEQLSVSGWAIDWYGDESPIEIE
jgi:hypothetical protein